MGVRDLLRVRKAGASQTAGPVPPAIDAALLAQGLSTSADLGPGRPIQPRHGYSTGVRGFDYPIGANISLRPRAAYGRPSFDTLRTLIDAWDLARACINHKIDDLRSMELLFLPADDADGDVDLAVKAARAALAFPDRELPFDAWLSKWCEGLWRYDAACLYRRRNRAGEVMALEVVDGTTILPYIDEDGRRPVPPAPAYAQIIKGLDNEWLTSDDLIYTPFRPQLDAPYGLAPIEVLLLTANTDLRFQMHFLNYFTAGSLPAGLLEAPEDTSSPDQVREWQDFWDALMLGDQEALRQIKVVPNGMKLDQLREASFDEAFPIYLMRRCCAVFGVVPQDLGITLDVNRANGDTQVDVQFRVNTRPSMLFIQGILTRYLQDDLGLPVKVEFDDGQEKEDRLATAQADKIYVEMGALGVSEVRERVYGLTEPGGRPVPRFVMTGRAGPIPLSALEAVAGPIDPGSGAPEPGAPLPHKPFAPVEGVAPQKPPSEPPLAVVRYPADNQESVGAAVEASNAPVTKADATGGVTAATGLDGYELDRDDDGEEQDDVDVALEVDVAKAAADERAVFGRFVRKRLRAGTWRDFAFQHLERSEADWLNKVGRAQVRKATGQLVAAGLAVVAADTGRVLMLQRGLDPTDPASGLWEFPGGHIEDGEAPHVAAIREWQEETGCLLPIEPLVAGAFQPIPAWVSPNGVYAGFVLQVPDETVVDVRERGAVTNPDDPDGDVVEALAWWDPTLLPGNPAIRAELAADVGLVLDAVALEQTPVEKAAAGGGSVPKAGWRGSAVKVPQHRYDLTLTDHYAPLMTDALHAAFPDDLLRDAITAAHAAAGSTVAKAADPSGDALRAAAKTALTAGLQGGRLLDTLRSLFQEAYGAGGFAAGEQLPGGRVLPGVAEIDWSTWQPGSPAAAGLLANGGLAQLLDQSGATVSGVTGSLLDQLGNTIADGVAHGDSVDTIAGTLGGIIDDPSRAEMIAHTETARAITQATLDTYAANDVQAWDWILSDDACPECEDQESQNPHQPGDEQPPLHPRCRCAVSPVVDDTGTGMTDEEAQ